jgi:hypothetical protein
MDPLDDPDVPASCSPDHEPEPSRSADATALDGIDATVEADVAGAVLVAVEPPTVNVVLTTGHRPLLVHDLKWIVWLPAPMATLVASTS